MSFHELISRPLSPDDPFTKGDEAWCGANRIVLI